MILRGAWAAFAHHIVDNLPHGVAPNPVKCEHRHTVKSLMKIFSTHSVCSTYQMLHVSPKLSGKTVTWWVSLDRVRSHITHHTTFRRIQDTRSPRADNTQKHTNSFRSQPLAVHWCANNVLLSFGFLNALRVFRSPVKIRVSDTLDF